MRTQNLDDLLGQDLEAAARDRAVAAPLVEDVSVRVDLNEIGGAHPVRADLRAIALHHPGFADGEDRAGFDIGDAQLDAGHRGADAAALRIADLGAHRGGPADDRAAELGRAHRPVDRDAELRLELVLDIGVEMRGAAEDALHAGEILGIEIAVEQHGHGGRREAERGRLMPLHRIDELGNAEPIEQDERGSGRGTSGEEAQAAYARQRPHADLDGLLALGLCTRRAQCGAVEDAGGHRDALGRAGRAARQHFDRRILEAERGGEDVVGDVGRAFEARILVHAVEDDAGRADFGGDVANLLPIARVDDDRDGAQVAQRFGHLHGRGDRIDEARRAAMREQAGQRGGMRTAIVDDEGDTALARCAGGLQRGLDLVAISADLAPAGPGTAIFDPAAVGARREDIADIFDELLGHVSPIVGRRADALHRVR